MYKIADVSVKIKPLFAFCAFQRSAIFVVETVRDLRFRLADLHDFEIVEISLAAETSVELEVGVFVAVGEGVVFFALAGFEIVGVEALVAIFGAGSVDVAVGDISGEAAFGVGEVEAGFAFGAERAVGGGAGLAVFVAVGDGGETAESVGGEDEVGGALGALVFCLVDLLAVEDVFGVGAFRAGGARREKTGSAFCAFGEICGAVVLDAVVDGLDRDAGLVGLEVVAGKTFDAGVHRLVLEAVEHSFFREGDTKIVAVFEKILLAFLAFGRGCRN